MAFKPIDGKRDEFRKYLERTGVLEAVSKVFVKLVNCPERPEDAIEFVRANLGDTMHQADTIEHLKQELEDARSEIARLKTTIATLKAGNMKVANVSEDSGENVNVEDSTNAPAKSSEIQEAPPAIIDQKDASTASSAESNDQGNETQNSSNKDKDESSKPAESN